AKSLLRYFRAFWVQSGIAGQPVEAGLKPASTLDCGIAIGTKWRKVSRFMLVASSTKTMKG
ncbi:MAG: hypothetical protein K8R06_11305, partial [Methanosarcinales archaeon]|nr:hypothetical protein [Methanosarcinales archaeon]